MGGTLVEESGGVQHADIRTDTGMRKNAGGMLPSEVPAYFLDAGVGLSVLEVFIHVGIMVGEDVPNAEIAAGNDDRVSRSAPGTGWNMGDQRFQPGQPLGRQGGFDGLERGERDLVAVGSEHRLHPQGSLPAQQHVVCLSGITGRRNAARCGNMGKRAGHGAEWARVWGNG